MLSVNISDIAIITVKKSVLEDRWYIQKNIVLVFSLFKAVFFTFLFRIYKMVDIMDVFKSLNISIKTVFKNPELLNFVPDHFKTKKMC